MATLLKTVLIPILITISFPNVTTLISPGTKTPSKAQKE